MKFKEITVSGTPYERGLTYGQLCREEIGVSIKVYQMLFDGLKNLAWEDARRISEKYLSLTRDFEPDYAEEMRGIAEGAGVVATAVGDLDDEAAGLGRRSVNAAFISHRIIPSSMVVIIYYTTVFP